MKIKVECLIFMIKNIYLYFFLDVFNKARPKLNDIGLFNTEIKRKINLYYTKVSKLPSLTSY